MLKASGAMAAATLASRVLGMVREMVYANFMGDGWVASAFALAFTIPNLFRRLLGEGALTAAFIPIFKEKEKTHGEIEMWRAANAVISGLVIAASVIIGLAMLGISLALAVHQFSAQTELMLRLLRVMFPYMLLVCIAAALMGMLNARGHFFIPAMGATMLNVVMIASVLFFAQRMALDLPKELRLPKQIFALAFGVLVAGVAQAAFQVPTLWREGFRYRWVSPWRNETVRLVVTRMIPGTIGVAAFQINVLLTQAIAFWVGPHIVASFNYAVRLMELPQGMFGISLATFLLPTLTGLALDKNYPEFRKTLCHGVSTLLFANLIAAILLVVLAEPIVRLLFERGAFTADSTQRASLALICLAPGLVAFSTVNILARAFFALGDTKTPMKISLACLAMNLILAVMLILPLKQRGLGIANTITSIANAGLLFFALRKKLGKLEMESLRTTFLPLAFAGIIAGIIAWFGWQFWENKFGHETIALKIGAVFVPAILAGLVYGILALAFKVPAAKEMLDFALAKFKR
ncbi:MAG TPA: murein biosynthesis integral membrane protein MurJ [Verrucomicrobiae bacterium]|jgi:putative peptidoglycan lipid II flippase|nr:murein biosynthesis integral membrane protein MurJ [Verrucomicrobiae bacterium]